jgi:hypothetical protein
MASGFLGGLWFAKRGLLLSAGDNLASLVTGKRAGTGLLAMPATYNAIKPRGGNCKGNLMNPCMLNIS